VSPPERTVVILVRAWTEAGSDVVQARIIRSDAGPGSQQVGTAVSGVDEICEVVRHWLEPLTMGADPATDC
jgi:hypothetical protein